MYVCLYKMIKWVFEEKVLLLGKVCTKCSLLTSQILDSFFSPFFPFFLFSFVPSMF